MDILLFAPAFLLLIPAGVVYIHSFTRSYYGLRLKAYSPVAAGLITAVCIASLFSLWLAVAMGHTAAQARLLRPVTRIAVLVALASLLPVAFAGIVRVIPNRPHPTGARQSKYLDWAATFWFERNAPVLGVLTMGVGISGFWWLSKAQFALRIIQVGFALCAAPAGLKYLRRLEHAPTASAMRAQDHRGCVLYIRPFYQEADDFTYGTSGRIQPYVQAPLDSGSFWSQATFEQYLGPAFSTYIGPFIAIGNPRDYRPPEGAAREYLEGEEWRDFFLVAAREAATIVMEPSCSRELAWEVSRLVQRGWQYKLFIVVRPVPKSPGRLMRWMFDGIRWSKRIRRPKWQEFAQFATAAGLVVPGEDPGPGTVIGFNRAGRAFTLITGAIEPNQFVLPIQRWISPAFSASSQRA